MKTSIAFALYLLTLSVVFFPLNTFANDILNAFSSDSRDVYTVQNLKHDCESNDGRTLYCFGFIEGVASGLIIGTNTYNQSNLICIPEGVNQEEQARAFTIWAKKHPQRHNLFASIGVFTALKEAFPCEKTK